MKRDIQWWQIIAVCILISGVILTVWSAQQQDQSLRAGLLTKASIAESGISAGQVASLGGSATDLMSPEYLELKGQLGKIRASDPEIRFAYVMGQREDGAIFIYADSEPPKSADYSPPGQEYTEAPTVIRSVFATGNKADEGPYTDRWGTWISGFIPVTDPSTGRVIAVFGMDVDAQNWNRMIFEASLSTLIATLLLVLLVLVSALFQRRSEGEKRRLETSEEKFRLLIENSHDIIFTMNTEHLFTFVSPGWTTLLGHPVTEVIGKSFQKFVHPDDIGMCLEYLQRMIATGERQPGIEYRVLHADGSWRWHIINAVPLHNEAGMIIGGEGSASDITERKRTNENLVATLKRTQEQHAALARISFSPHLLSGDVHGLSVNLTTVMSTVLGVERAGVWLFSSNGDELRCIDLYEASYGRHSCNGVLKRHEFGNEFDALSEALYIDAHDSLTDPRTAGYVESYMIPNHITSMLDSVIRISGKNLGVLCFEHVDRPHHWESDEIAFACQLADQVAITLLNRDRNLAEEAVKQARHNFETFFDTIDEFLYVLDEQGRILHTNETVTRRLGYTREELFRQPVLMVHPPDRRDEVGRTVQGMLAGTMDFCPVSVMTKDGHLIPVETRVIKGEWNGRPVLFGISKDLSDLRISEEKFSAAFHFNTALMAISTKHDGKFIEVNEAFLETLGFSREEIIGKHVRELHLFMHPEDRSATLRDLEGEGEKRDLEVMVRAKDGSIRYGLFSVDTIMIGEIPCLLTTMVDITGRKRAEVALSESEEKYRLIFEYSPLGHLSFDEKGVIVACNDKFIQIIGSSREALIGLDMLILPDIKIVSAVQDALDGNVGLYEGVYSSVTAKKVTPVRGIFAPMDIGGGRIPGGVGIFEDITNRKLAEDTLLKVNQKLNVLSQFSRKDLTNKLFILNSYLELATQEAYGQEKIIENLQKCEEAARSINEITEFTKDYQDLGAKPPAWQNVKMTLLFGLSHLSIGKIQHSLELENLEIFADPLLEKAFQGLFENSLAHGGHVSRIRVWHMATPDEVTLFFEDNGEGVPYEKKEQIFLHQEGAGASVRGLFFIKEILSITGITIRETGEPGKGARFEMTVPKGTWRTAGTVP